MPIPKVAIQTLERLELLPEDTAMGQAGPQEIACWVPQVWASVWKAACWGVVGLTDDEQEVAQWGATS